MAKRSVSYLLAHDADEHELQELLNMLDRATDSILALVDRVLDGERLDAGQMQLDVQRLDPRALLATTNEQIETVARENDVGLNLRIEDALPTWILADSVKLDQIMRNLIGNAI